MSHLFLNEVHGEPLEADQREDSSVCPHAYPDMHFIPLERCLLEVDGSKSFC